MEQSDTGAVQLDSLLATLRGHLTVGAAQSDSTARALIERVELVADEDHRIQPRTIVLAPVLPQTATRTDRGPEAVVVSQSHVQDARTLWPNVPVLVKAPWVAWSELFLALAQLVEVAGAHSEATSGCESLDQLATTVSELTVSSVTIENDRGVLLAYSPTPNTVDEIRQQTILSGSVPQWRLAAMEEAGFFDILRTAQRLVVRPETADAPARLVMPVRAGGRLIGSIWATESALPLEELERIFADAATNAARLMLRDAWSLDEQHSRQQQVVRELLHSETDPAFMARTLGSPPAAPVCVIMWQGGSAQLQAAVEFALRKIAGRVWLLHDDGLHTALVEFVDAAGGDERLSAGINVALEAVIARHTGAPVVARSAIGVLTQVRALYCEASDVLAAATHCAHSGGGAVLSSVDIPFAIATWRVLQTAAPDAVAAVRELLTPLREHDAQRHTSLVNTLRVVLSNDGKLVDVARSLNIHSNSLRYRIARIEEIIGGSLHDRDTRTALSLALMLEGPASNCKN